MPAKNIHPRQLMQRQARKASDVPPPKSKAKPKAADPRAARKKRLENTPL